MFEKAREFRERYYVTPEPAKDDNDLVMAGKILEKHAQNYCRRSSKLRSEILVIENEISLIQEDLGEFLMLYYEKFSAVLIDNGIFSQKDYQLNPAFKEDDETVSLFEKRAQAYNNEVKNIYRKLVKAYHPDMNGNAREAELFYRIQSSYEKNDLSELLYIQAQIDTRREKNIIEKIEKLEMEIRIFQKKLIKLIEKKSDLLSTPEYKLFIKFKLSEVRGYDFFGELLKSTHNSSWQLN